MNRQFARRPGFSQATVKTVRYAYSHCDGIGPGLVVALMLGGVSLLADASPGIWPPINAITAAKTPTINAAPGYSGTAIPDPALHVADTTNNANTSVQGDGTEQISVEFNQVSTRAALQIIADFVGLNIIVSDTVEGKLSFQVVSRPWARILDDIFHQQALTARQSGNVIMVAPAQEVAALEEQLWRFAYELIDFRFFRVILACCLVNMEKSCDSS